MHKNDERLMFDFLLKLKWVIGYRCLEPKAKRLGKKHAEPPSETATHLDTTHPIKP